MKNRLLVVIICTLMLMLSGCAAKVKLASYPGLEAEDISADLCNKREQYSMVRVLGVLPPQEQYDEIGYITAYQSAGDFSYTSEEKIIKAARKKACRWGADAIVIIESVSDKGKKYNFWTGEQKKDERQLRIVAIKLKTKAP